MQLLDWERSAKFWIVGLEKAGKAFNAVESVVLESADSLAS
jgi:hypothetical protein